MEEERTIESLVRVLRDEIKFVHAFVIAFKQQDNRMTHSLRSMIGNLFNRWRSNLLLIIYRKTSDSPLKEYAQ